MNEREKTLFYRVKVRCRKKCDKHRIWGHMQIWQLVSQQTSGGIVQVKIWFCAIEASIKLTWSILIPITHRAQFCLGEPQCRGYESWIKNGIKRKLWASLSSGLVTLIVRPKSTHQCTRGPSLRLRAHFEADFATIRNLIMANNRICCWFAVDLEWFHVGLLCSAFGRDLKWRLRIWETDCDVLVKWPMVLALAGTSHKD